ncbi:tannase/feruloyl esterase family alpha/beta hydrolase [Pseudomonas syringae]|nr:tannase/feruloyl esterase family alpha/beta hydrolase [Pseudomonas syringae]
MRTPADADLSGDWNLRLQSVGNGGYAGFIPYDALGNALKDGYVAAATDTGHAASSLDGRFAMKPDRSIDEGLVEDFAHRSVHEMTLNAKKLINAFYHTGPRYSYWNGCSTGGRQGLMEAQRYPTDYDGILAGAPAIHWDRFIVAELWPQVVMHQELGHPIAAEKLTALSKAILATFDNADGVTDGIVANPSQINVPDELIKQAGLNDKELRAVRKIWSGPRDVHGHALWYELEPSAPFTGLAGPQPFPIPVAYLGLWLQQNPEWDWKQLTYAGYEKLFMESQQRYHAIIGTDNPDLSAFKQAGGKLIMWHGWNDQLIFPKGTIDYHQRLLKAMGGAAHTDDFARLFMAPGVEYCRGGAGPNQIAGMEALTQWVEGEKAPDSLTARKIVDSLTVMERPLCAYPQEAVYDGHGDANTAAAFVCTSTLQTKNRSQ